MNVLTRARTVIIAILVLTLSALTLTAWADTASAAPLHSAARLHSAVRLSGAARAHVAAARTTPPGHTIKTAGTLTLGNTAHGGGGPIDFWKVRLNGGDRVQFTTDYPSGNTYIASLYAPGTTDATFPTAVSFSTATTNPSATQTIFTLQAPYNGTFILAVCQNVSYDNCAKVPDQSGTNPMNPYTFGTVLFPLSPSPTVAAQETRASATIAGAPTISTGVFEAGGGGPIDFWKLPLARGENVQFTVGYPSGNTYAVSLYAPGTTDATFSTASAVSGAITNSSVTLSTLTLQAPYNGTFILAVCQNVSYNNCSNVPDQSGTNPMYPYTFETVGPKSSTSLTLSTSSVTYANEKSLKITAAVKGSLGLTPSGGVVITGGGTTICTIARLSGGTGSCSPGSNTLLKPGAYRLAATYSGDLAGSSGTAELTVKPNLSTSTTLKLSATTVTYGHEGSLKLTGAVKARYGGSPAGKIVITGGGKTICMITLLVNGAGTCSPASNALLAAGTYELTATYGGSYLGSRSGEVSLTVRP
jgi:hypothetical protein